MAEIRIKYWPGATPLEQWDIGGCVDLYNYNEISLDEGEWGIIHLGVAMDVPEGYDSLIFPRSSTFQKYGILQTNSVGYVDHAYKGPNDEWMVKVYATRACYIPAGTRCFQFRLIPQQPKLDFIISDLLDNDSRGGFGSTGE